MIRLCALLLFWPGAAIAAPWEGVWSHQPEWCALSNQIGAVTPAPIRLTRAGLRGYENRCTVAQEVDLGLNATRLRLNCRSTGDDYEDNLLLMVEGDKMWIWYAATAEYAADMIEYIRCQS